ncbi:hypothetical protein [Winogradskyella sp.]|jgi:hypothetical protein|uniref:hypothetical protein n=1 Tax=Winogradskyella sp. TaxID=1883156 RepID=UPI0025FB4701|nr:hypothetical protein [Winogradskyella sp.]MCT4628451.1 hypothetical protein [Winogradskyella sp.]
MKQLLLIILSFLVFNINAQEKTQPKKEQQLSIKNNNAEALANKETQKLTKQLELSYEQQKRVYDIYIDHFENELKTKKLITLKDKSSKEKTAKLKSAKTTALNTKLKEVLTTEQYTSYINKEPFSKKQNKKKLQLKN